MFVYRRKIFDLIFIEGGLASTMTTGLFTNGFGTGYQYNTPNVIVCSLEEMEATTPSTELQTLKNLNVCSFLFLSFDLYLLLLFSISNFVVKIICTIQLSLESRNHWMNIYMIKSVIFYFFPINKNSDVKQFQTHTYKIIRITGI
jgi:hypothetical protein